MKKSIILIFSILLLQQGYSQSGTNSKLWNEQIESLQKSISNYSHVSKQSHSAWSYRIITTRNLRIAYNSILLYKQVDTYTNTAKELNYFQWQYLEDLIEVNLRRENNYKGTELILELVFRENGSTQYPGRDIIENYSKSDKFTIKFCTKFHDADCLESKFSEHDPKLLELVTAFKRIAAINKANN